ncbi:MAG: lamin tail domain-containing protein [Candidatus Kerfeldbacteria bacterium]
MLKVEKYFIIIIVIIIVSINFVSAEAEHIVISEIKITGGSGFSTDEFLELYNPTDQDVSLANWSLIKQTAAGNEYILVENFNEKLIKAHAFILIAHPAGYSGEINPDIYYSTTNSISSNNSVILLNDMSEEVDKVGMGASSDYEGEATSNPGSNKSIERKAKSTSDSDSMVEGGKDYFLGNSEDTDNNANDFIISSQLTPQNSSSEVEYLEIVIPDNNSDNPIMEGGFGDIIITELFPNPLGSDDSEFIELYNNDTKEINLAGWQLGDNSTRRYIISIDDFDTTFVGPNQYIVIEKEISKISLNNTTDAAYLYDANGTLVEKIEYEKSQEDKSYSLISEQWIWSSDYTPGRANNFVIDNNPPVAKFELEEINVRVGQIIQLDASSSSDPDEDKLLFRWNFGNEDFLETPEVEYSYKQVGDYVISLTVIDELGAEDIIEQIIHVTDYDYSDKIILSEILPSCEGADADCEFIEIYNDDGREINLAGWKLTDLKNEYFFPNEIIEQGDYLVVDRKESKITLNNSGDVIYLIDPRDKIINGVEYKDAKSDLSFSYDRNNNQWSWTEEITPSNENIIVFSEIDNEVEMAQEELENLSPMEINISNVNETLLGRVLIVTGEVESIKSLSIYLMDEAGHLLRVYIQKKTNINKPDVEPGDKMTVVGLLDKTSAGLRLLPRTEEDISITKRQIEPNSTKVLGVDIDETETYEFMPNNKDKQVKLYLYITVGFLIIIIGGLLIKKFYINNSKSDDHLEKDDI